MDVGRHLEDLQTVRGLGEAKNTSQLGGKATIFLGHTPRGTQVESS